MRAHCISAHQKRGLLVDPIITTVEKHLPDNVTQWHRNDKICIDSLRTELRNALTPLNEPGGQDLDAGAAFNRALKLVADFEAAYRDEARQAKRKGWSAEDPALTWNQIVEDSSWALDVASVKDTAFHILGKTPEQLCAQIPKAFRIVHVESVLRQDLAHNFLAYQGRLEERAQCEDTTNLRKILPPHSSLHRKGLSGVRREDLIQDTIKPRVTYHGTPLRNVASIVRNGFRMSGTVVDGVKVASPRSGIAFNRGIYSSQAPHYALSYAGGQMQKTPLGEIPGMRLFVCATLMGRTLKEGHGGPSERIHGPLVDGFDAHFDGNFEYIVHDKRAMLPCYVIHLDLGAQAAQAALKSAQENPVAFAENQQKASKPHRKLQQQQLAPGDAKREKEMRKAAAMKWFPYGFGAATGTSFMIEEVGEISDDEEDYGEWQQERHGYIKRRSSYAEVDDDRQEQAWYNGDEDGSDDRSKSGGVLDQYQHARYG